MTLSGYFFLLGGKCLFHGFKGHPDMIEEACLASCVEKDSEVRSGLSREQ